MCPARWTSFIAGPEAGRCCDRAVFVSYAGCALVQLRCCKDSFSRERCVKTTERACSLSYHSYMRTLSLYEPER